MIGGNGSNAYVLSRTWDESKPICGFIGINPSEADEVQPDQTTKRCINFARDWGFGGLLMLNLFAVVEKYPENLHQHPDPIGPDNDYWLTRCYEQTHRMVACVGTTG